MDKKKIAYVLGGTLGIASLSYGVNWAVSNYNNRQDEQDKKVAKLEVTLENNYNTLDQKIENVNKLASENKSDITSLNIRSDELNTSLNVKYDELHNSQSKMQIEIININEHVSNLSENVTKLTSDATNLYNNDATINNKITKLESKVGIDLTNVTNIQIKLQKKITKIENNITNICKIIKELEDSDEPNNNDNGNDNNTVISNFSYNKSNSIDYIAFTVTNPSKPVLNDIESLVSDYSKDMTKSKTYVDKEDSAGSVRRVQIMYLGKKNGQNYRNILFIDQKEKSNYAYVFVKLQDDNEFDFMKNIEQKIPLNQSAKQKLQKMIKDE